MAENFAPILPEKNTEDFLQYSRGYEDRSGSTLFRGLGDALDTGVKAIDRGLTQRVQDEVRAAVENADAALGINSNPRMESRALPDEVVSKIERLRINREAMLAGKLNPEHYYNRLHTESKKIRSRWGGRDGASGYTEQIDEAFKSLIGTTPANALRRELQAQAEAATNAARASASDDERWLDARIAAGEIPPKYLKYVGDPNFRSNPQAILQLKADVALEQTYNSELQREQLLLTLQKSRGENTERSSAKLYSREVNKILNDTIETGATYREMISLASNERNRIAAGETANPNALKDILNKWGIVKQQLNDRIAQKKIMYGADAGKEIEQYDNHVNNIIANIEKGLTDNNVGLVMSAAADAKILTDTAKAETLRYSEVTRAGAALRETMGEAAFGAFLMSEGGAKFRTEIENFGNRAIKIDAATGQSKSYIDSLTKFREAIRNDPEAAKNEATFITNNLNEVINSVFDPKIDNKTRVNLFNSLYGKDNQKMWVTLGADRKRQMVLKLLSPTAYQEVRKLSAATGDGNIMDNYQRTLDNLAYETAKPHIDTLNEIGETVSDKRIDYDPTTNRIRVVEIDAPDLGDDAGFLGGALRSGLQTMFNSINATGVTEAQQDINTILSSYEAMWKEKGYNQQQINTNSVVLLNKLGINMGQAGRNILDRALGAERKNIAPGSRMNLSQEVESQRTSREIEAEDGTQIELDETIQLFNDATSEEERQLYKNRIFELMSLDPEKMSRLPATILAPAGQ